MKVYTFIKAQNTDSLYIPLISRLHAQFLPGTGDRKRHAGILNINEQPFSIRTETGSRPFTAAEISCQRTMLTSLQLDIVNRDCLQFSFTRQGMQAQGFQFSVFAENQTASGTDR